MDLPKLTCPKLADATSDCEGYTFYQVGDGFLMDEPFQICQMALVETPDGPELRFYDDQSKCRGILQFSIR